MFLVLMSIARAACPDASPLRQPYFGDLHVHTHYSLDASVQGTVTSHEEAYAFAQGESLKLPQLGRSLAISSPLDFVAITDHAELLGELAICHAKGTRGYRSPSCVMLRRFPAAAFVFINSFLARTPKKNREGLRRFPYCGLDGKRCLSAAEEVWKDMVAQAEEANEPCAFTAFPAYEWSGSPKVENLHRNVVFRDADVPDLPISYFDASTDVRLWRALDEECIGDCRVLTIPHNSNLSSGRMFTPLEEIPTEGRGDYARSRAEKEPLVEIFQHKGASECLPNAVDEQCAFETMPFNNLIADRYGGRGTGPPSEQDTVRWALAEGLAFEAAGLENPYQYGIIASTDTHLGTPGAISETAFAGHGGAGQAGGTGLVDSPWFNPGGLAGVWAEENTRESLFAAMERKEAWGTSGPRIQLRFFATDSGLVGECGGDEWLSAAYAEGVAMGGVLQSGSPIFHVVVERDPSSQPLQRLQVIKGSVDGEGHRTEVHELFRAPDGREGICLSWSDPGYSQGDSAYYYVRVLEVPSVRWSAAACREVECPEAIPQSVQERAWSSPIWIRP
jgi:hypothetical protein